MPDQPIIQSNQPDAAVLRRAAFAAVRFFIFLALVLFLPGGIAWWEGWVFFFVFIALMGLCWAYLRRKNPEIFAARSKTFRPNTKTWDRVIVVILLASFMAVFPLAGLDNRWGWSCVPVWLVGLGYVPFCLGFAMATWAEGFNKFAEPSVRIQTERGHKVVDAGPYATIRHPIYLGAFFLFGGIPLALGSYWAFIPVTACTVVMVVRTALEDRTLRNELDGYKEYASRVRYRLLPGIW